MREDLVQGHDLIVQERGRELQEEGRLFLAVKARVLMIPWKWKWKWPFEQCCCCFCGERQRVFGGGKHVYMVLKGLSELKLWFCIYGV